jgi:kynurenine formamidase
MTEFRASAGGRLVELNHVIRAGMITYPGLPGPAIASYLTREASRDHYAPGTEFAIDELTRAGAEWLATHGAALVGIDALNIDDIEDGNRPAHTLLLAAGIPVVEHLTGLEQLPPSGARFTAVPLRIEGFGSFPVRAFAQLPE